MVALAGWLCAGAGSVWLCCTSAWGEPPAKPGGSFLIPAYAYDRGVDVVTCTAGTSSYVDAEPMVGNLRYPSQVEYDIEFPVSGEYTLHIRYAAHTARPLAVWLDGKDLGLGCRTPTGGWNTSQASWERTCQLSITSGKHTLKLSRDGSFPHVVALRFESASPLPEGWKLRRPGAKRLPEPPFSPNEVKVPALQLAISDLVATFGARFPEGPRYLQRLAELAAKMELVSDEASGELQELKAALVALRREALLANPLLNFDKLLLVNRGAGSPRLGLPQNWESNSSLPKTGYDDQIAVLSPLRPDGQITTLFKPAGGQFVGDVDLRFDADRLLFSMPGANGRWQVFEIRADGSGLRQLTGQQPDVDSYDACYLPDGQIVFTSTACYIGVPCVTGASHVATLYRMDADGGNIRQLCFDQEHNWCPVVRPDGRVLYSRWEYTDTPHSNTRLLFSMNPDGTEQRAYYGSNSYWPNAIFYARPIPGYPSQVVGIVGGHHDHPRMGELVIFDTARGRFEADGVVQRIPGFGRKVEPIIADGLTLNSWPKFLHPYPLSDKYFLVSAKPTPQSLWGIYLVDVFDNMVLIKELPDYALFEPLPFRPTAAPPIIPAKVDLARRDAEVYIPDIYAGDGLNGIPRGTVRALRLLTYHFAYHNLSGSVGVVGMDGPWDIKRVIGKVPVHADGSARFRIPANTPISLQPLDADGKALQLMRSWMTAMPGETITCAGCHENQNTVASARPTMALSERPVEIQPWYGPLRGFAYAREVQPVIDRHCTGCHDGRLQPDGRTVSDLRGTEKITDYRIHNMAAMGGRFSVGYAELHRFVRRPCLESDYHLLAPMEFHADTTELVQLLTKGHYGVQLDAEGWDRLITWIDLNCPFHGTWGEDVGNPGAQRQRRRDLLRLYGNVDDDPEAIPQLDPRGLYARAPEPIRPAVPAATPPPSVDCPNWPFDAAEARQRQQAAGDPWQRTVALGDRLEMQLVLIPAGEFIMGSSAGALDERPPTRVRLEAPFWMGACEVTNQQYAQFDPSHDSHFESMLTACHGVHGHPVNRPEQPVVRVSWMRAMDFCRWLSEKTGARFSLPTEAQWEWACRAGTATPMYHGAVDSDFSPFANLADAKLSHLARDWYIVDKPLPNPTKYDDWIPKDPRFDDGAVLSIAPGKYRPNAWGLHDMHGNVAEWTRTSFRPYPYRPADGRDAAAGGRKVVRGGSWRERPQYCTSSYRLSYPPYQRVYNVGFRVVCERPEQKAGTQPSPGDARP
jgi:formylglycine-generating enzyme required for sulfatase activity